MGEIGFPRQEFLHDLRWWEVKSIIRGYNNRHHAAWEQARLVAYNARFCMGSKDPLPLLNEWIKFPWEEKAPTPVSTEDIDDMQALINAENERIKKSSEE